MVIPDDKRSFLGDKLGAKGLEGLEARLAGKAKELEELDVEFKGADEESQEVAEQEVEEVEPEGAEEEAVEESQEESKEAEEETPNYVTAEEVVEAVGAYLKPIIDRLGALTSIEEALVEQGKEIKALQKSTEEKVKETIANTPAASLFDHFASTIGSPETYIDGRSSLAKAGPKETKDEAAEGPTLVGLVNEMMAQSWGQKQ